MFIQTEQTPNPATLKFLPGRAVLDSGTANFTSRETAGSSPLAARLFDVDGVSGVYLGADFISVSKTDANEWFALKPQILGIVMEHFTTGQLVLIPGQADLPDADGEDDDVVSRIKELIEMRVRPAVAQDGGDIVFDSFDEGVVYLQMHGACSGCPSSTATLKAGIENMLKHYVPEVHEVRAV